MTQMSLFDEYGDKAPDKRTGETIECLKASEGLKASRRMSGLAKQKAEAEPPKNSYHYWRALSELMEAWVKLMTYSKRENVYDDETRCHKVEHVVEKYNRGIEGLRSTRKMADSNFKVCLDNYNATCVLYGVKPVNLSWFYKHLYEYCDYDSYRSRIQTRLNNSEKYPPVALVDFPPRKVKK